MIDEVLDIIKDEVDGFLKLKMKDSGQQYVHLVPVVDLSGKPSINENTISMSLVRIEDDRINMSSGREYTTESDRIYYSNPVVRLNLYILFSAAYVDGQEKNYKEALKRISYVIACFQAKSVFTSSNTPRLNPGFGRVSMELSNIELEEQSHFWGTLGNLYRPSVLYRLRALRFQEGTITGIATPTGEKDITVGDKK